MPRPVRVHLTEALYYVTCKAAEGFHLFKDSTDYETYVGFLKNYREQFAFKLFAFCLLPNEVHLLIEPTNETTVSEIMHALNSRYTKHVIRRYEHMGHVFQERFRSTVIEKKANSLLELTAVVHRLPVDCAITPDASAYRWSSLSSYLAEDGSGLSLPSEIQEVNAALNPGTRYEVAVRSLIDSVYSYWRAELAHPVVGSEDFHRLVQEKARLAKEAKAASSAMIVQAPEASSANVTRAVLPVFAGSAAVALLSLGIVVAALRHQTNLQQTVRILGRQVQSSVSQMAQGQDQSNSQKLATYAVAAQLAGTSWDIQVAAADGIGAKPAQEDELLFDSGKVASKMLSRQGFSSTNYSLTLEPDGTVKWETMATGASGEIICWQGQVSGQQMQGMMTRQLPGQAALNFNFHGIAKPMQEASVRTVGHS